MKKTMFIHMIAGLSYTGGAIWGIVEAIDYFVNKSPVNWNFIIPILLGIAVGFGNMISMMRD